MEDTSSKCCKFSSVEKVFFHVFKIQVLGLKCGIELFDLLRVSILKFEKVWKKVFQIVESFKLLKASNFKCVKKSFLPLFQVSSQISILCKKGFQVFDGFLVKVLFCDI